MTFICIPRQWPKNLLPRSTKETMRYSYEGGCAGYQYNIYTYVRIDLLETTAWERKFIYRRNF